MDVVNVVGVLTALEAQLLIYRPESGEFEAVGGAAVMWEVDTGVVAEHRRLEMSRRGTIKNVASVYAVNTMTVVDARMAAVASL